MGVSPESRSRIAELDSLTEFQRQASTAVRLKPLFSAIPLLSYCFAIDAKFPFSPTLQAEPVSPAELDALLNPPLRQHHFAFPTYPVIPAENEQIRPFATRPWRHVASWSLKPAAGSFALDPSSLALPVSTPAGELCGFPALETPLVPAESGIPAELPSRAEFKGEGAGAGDLGDWGNVERALVSWEEASLREFNANADCVMDSFLYGALPVEKSRFTTTPERFSVRSALSLSVSVSKSSEMPETTRKRARKRAREGEEEEKEKPESIRNFISQKMRLSTFTWTRREEEALFTLVSQFGANWNLICNVFVLENSSHPHIWKQYPEGWRFVAQHKRLVDAAIPIEFRYTCIPQKTLSSQKNPFFAYCYPFLKEFSDREDDRCEVEVEVEDEVGEKEKGFGRFIENSPKQSMEEEREEKKGKEKESNWEGNWNGSSKGSTRQLDSASPIDAIFAAVEAKQVPSALFKPSTLDEAQMADLKKRDSLIAKYETDRLKRLQRFLRPETSAANSKELARRAPASFRNPSSLGSDPSSLNSLQNPDKMMRSRVPVRSFPMPRPGDIKKLRENAIRMLPIAQILIKSDVSKFQHLLDSHRRPQDGIVVPYEQALEQGQRLLEESAKQHSQLAEMDRKAESDVPVKLEADAPSLPHSKSQAAEVMEGLRDLFDALPSLSREAQELARSAAAAQNPAQFPPQAANQAQNQTQTTGQSQIQTQNQTQIQSTGQSQPTNPSQTQTKRFELDDSSPVISFDLKAETGETGELAGLMIAPPAPVLVSSIATAPSSLSAPPPAPPETPKAAETPAESPAPSSSRAAPRRSREFPFLVLVEELASRSAKRDAAAAQLEEAVNLKQQKIPRSSLERVRRAQPAIEPYPYCPTDSQHTCNNNRFLQRCLKMQNEQLRNPLFLSQMSALQRKDGIAGAREMGEVGKRGRREA